MTADLRIRHRSPADGQRGQTMVEAALVSIIFFTVLFGIIGFSRAIWAYSWTSHAAREASRYASVRGQDSGLGTPDVDGYVKAHMMGLDPTSVTVATNWYKLDGTADPDHKAGNSVQVTVSYDVNQIVPFVPTMTVRSVSRMTISQ